MLVVLDSTQLKPFRSCLEQKTLFVNGSKEKQNKRQEDEGGVDRNSILMINAKLGVNRNVAASSLQADNVSPALERQWGW